MKYHILLLEDVINRGRKGELVYVQPGFARNFLLPQKKALLVTKTTLRLRARLQEEREKQAKEDREESLKMKEKIEHKQFEITVKVDPEGHMYGSVGPQEIELLLTNAGYKIDKKWVAMPHPIKKVGNQPVTLKLPEGVEVSIAVEVKPDRPIKKKAELKAEEPKQEGQESAKEEEPKQEG